MAKRISKKAWNKIFEEVFGKEEAKYFIEAKVTKEERYEAKNG